MTDDDKVTTGGGVDDEIIDVLELSLDEARALVAKGANNNSPPSCLLGVLWFLTNRSDRAEWILKFDILFILWSEKQLFKFLNSLARYEILVFSLDAKNKKKENIREVRHKIVSIFHFLAVVRDVQAFSSEEPMIKDKKL